MLELLQKNSLHTRSTPSTLLMPSMVFMPVGLRLRVKPRALRSADHVARL